MYKVTVIIPVYNQEELVIRAIESIPTRNDIEIIVIDDCSTDNTWNNLLQYSKMNNLLNFICLYNEENKGVAYTVNRGYDVAQGEYIVLLGSDDYFYTDKFNEIMQQLDGTDLIYFNLELNNGSILKVTEETKKQWCGSVKFMRKEFIGDTRNPEKKQGEDLVFYQELLKKKPTEKFTDVTIKHYNYPRLNSLTDLYQKGML